MTQWIILSCIINSEFSYDIVSLLKEEYFYEELPRNIYKYILELVQKDIRPSLSLIKSRFPNDKIEENFPDDVEYDSYKEYIENLRKTYVNEEIKKVGQAISSRDIDEEKFIQYVNKFLNNIALQGAEDIHYADSAIEKVLELINSEEEIISEILFGIESVDSHTKGLFPGDLIMIAGRPSMGKTAVMCNTAIQNAWNGKVTLMCSLEMNEVRIWTRMLSNKANIELWKLARLSNRKSEEQKRVMSIANKFKELALIIDTTAIITVNHLRSIAQKIKLKYGRIDLIIVDYLQLMTGPGLNDNSRVSEISKNLKGIAGEFKVPVVMGSQLSRACEARDNKRPLLSDLRDSGSIEQDADMVFFLYRDHYYNFNPNNERILEVNLKKWRNGEAKKIIVDYDLKKQTIRPMNYNTALGKVARRFEFE